MADESKPAPPSSPLCILGMHRSGTSLLMQMLRELGVYCGDQEILSSSGVGDNPTGYWEHAGFRQLNDRVLAHLGGTWKAPPTLPPSAWNDVCGDQGLLDSAMALVDSFDGQPVWGWKDPRTCLTFPFWKQIIPGLRGIILFRNPLQVALSMQTRRDSGNLRHSVGYSETLRLWKVYYENVFDNLRSNRDWPVVNYEVLLAQPAAELTRICTALNIELDPSLLERATGKAVQTHLRNAVSENLIRHADDSGELWKMYNKLSVLAGSKNAKTVKGKRYDLESSVSDSCFFYQKYVECLAPEHALRSRALAAPPSGMANDGAKASDIDVVVVHYSQVRATVAMLRCLFTHYPELRVTLVDNSGGACDAVTLVLPQLGRIASQVKVLINPAKDRGAAGGLSHGAGIDLALAASSRRYLLSMEPDTFVLARGAIEYLCGLMDGGFAWAGYGQKPIDGEFASFSPCFAMFRIATLRRHGLSFRRRPRRKAEIVETDPLIRHHRLAAERVRAGLPLEYPEGKPPDTYRMPPEKIIEIELQHETYFDTGEWLHRELVAEGERGFLFRPLASVCHTWGSRSEALFLRNFRHRLPTLDINALLPVGLQLALDQQPAHLPVLKLIDEADCAPARHWFWLGRPPGRLSVEAGRLRVDIAVDAGSRVYLAMGKERFDTPPDLALGSPLPSNALCSLRCSIETSGTLQVELWLIEYSASGRLCHHACGPDAAGVHMFEFVSAAVTDRFRVLFRFSGEGACFIDELSMQVGRRSAEDECAGSARPT